MTTIFYKKILGSYEISEITQSSVGDLKIEFEAPFDGKLLIESSVFDIYRGVSTIQTRHLPDGEISPKIYAGSGMERIEGFILSRGAIVRKAPDADYVKRLSITTDALLSRVQKLEAALGKIENKIERQITF